MHVEVRHPSTDNLTNLAGDANAARLQEGSRDLPSEVAAAASFRVLGL